MFQEFFAGKTFYGCHVAVVMTNSTFSDSARQLANQLGVVLWDGDFISGGTPHQEPLKSVYDPSPRGFVVVSSPVYANFGTGSPSALVTGEGWNLGTGSGSNTVFFPFAYGRNEGNTTFSDAYYWSATSDAYNDANYKYTSKVLKITGTTVGTSHHNKAEVMPVRSIAQTRF